MKKNGYIYLDKENSLGILYDKYSGKIYKIPQQIAVSARNDSLTEENKNKINDLLSDSPVHRENSESGVLNHLRLMTTNKCNFNCTYCYADGGTYGVSTQKVMSPETSIDIIKWAYSKYYKVKQISFFGGEPLLNLEVMESVCLYITENYGSGAIKHMPFFSVVTNGYLLTDEVIELFCKYNIHPVVSIDGPKLVHDKQRLLKNGDGTYDTVYSNLKKLREKMVFSIEATFTKNHDLSNLTMKETSDFLKKEFNINRIIVNHVHTYSNGNPDHLEDFSSQQGFDYAEYFEAFFNDEPYVYTDIMVRLINTFKNDYYLETFCDAGLSQYTIDWEGNVLPCHIFTGRSDKLLGNIYSDEMNSVKGLFDEKKIGYCRDCSDKRFCQTCLLDIENKEYNCENFREGLNTFYDKMIELFVFNKEKYKELVNGIIEFGKE